eukprot:sb/3469828/
MIYPRKFLHFLGSIRNHLLFSDFYHLLFPRESGHNQNWTSLLEVVEISSASILPFCRSKSTNTSACKFHRANGRAERDKTQGLFLSGIQIFGCDVMGASDKNSSVIANLYYLQQTCPILILSTLTLKLSCSSKQQLNTRVVFIGRDYNHHHHHHTILNIPLYSLTARRALTYMLKTHKGKPSDFLKRWSLLRIAWDHTQIVYRPRPFEGGSNTHNSKLS